MFPFPHPWPGPGGKGLYPAIDGKRAGNDDDVKTLNFIGLKKSFNIILIWNEKDL